MLIYDNNNAFEVEYVRKVELLKDRAPDVYQKIEKNVQDIIAANRGDGLDAIIAHNLMERVISMSDEELINNLTGGKQ